MSGAIGGAKGARVQAPYQPESQGECPSMLMDSLETSLEITLRHDVRNLPWPTRKARRHDACVLSPARLINGQGAETQCRRCRDSPSLIPTLLYQFQVLSPCSSPGTPVGSNSPSSLLCSPSLDCAPQCRLPTASPSPITNTPSWLPKCCRPIMMWTLLSATAYLTVSRRCLGLTRGNH